MSIFSPQEEQFLIKAYNEKYNALCFMTRNSFNISSKRFPLLKIDIPEFKRDKISARLHIERELEKNTMYLL